MERENNSWKKGMDQETAHKNNTNNTLLLLRCDWKLSRDGIIHQTIVIYLEPNSSDGVVRGIPSKTLGTLKTLGSQITLGDNEMGFEQALEKVINELQQCLNQVQYNLRQMTQLADRGEDFETEANMSAEVEDTLLGMNKLFLDLLDMSEQLISIPLDPIDKAFFKKFKAERKLIKKQKLKEYEDNKKAEKQQRKKNSLSDITE